MSILISGWVNVIYPLAELTDKYTSPTILIFDLILVVERIVDRQMPDEDAEYPDYYVKWRNLPYSEATWESGKLIEEENGEQVRQFRMREESRYTPSKSNRVLKHR